MSTQIDVQTLESRGGRVRARPYADNVELLTALEEEVVAWIEAYLARHPSAAEGSRLEAPEPLPQVELATCRARLESMARVRRERLAVSSAEIPWQRLIGSLGLSEFEQLVLAYLFALREGPRLSERVTVRTRGYRRVVIDDDGWSSVGRILSVFCFEPREALDRRQVFAMDGALFGHGLLTPLHMGRGDSLLAESLTISAETAAAIIGDAATFSHLRAGVRVERPSETFDQVVLPDASVTLLGDIAQHHGDIERTRRNLGLDDMVTYGRGTTVLFYGPPGTGKTLAARALAGVTGRPLVMLDSGAVPSDSYLEPDELLRIGLMEAYRCGGILFVDECEEYLAPESLRDQQLGAILSMLERADGLVVFATNKPLQLTAALERRILYRLHFPVPAATNRERIWKLLVPSAFNVSPEDLESLARRFLLSGGYIKNAILQAVQSLVVAERRGEPVAAGIELLREAAEQQAVRLQDAFGPLASVRKAINKPRVIAEHTQAEELREVVALARQFVDDPRMQALSRELDEPSLRILFHGDDVATALEAAQTVAHALDMPVLQLAMEELASDDAHDRQSIGDQQISTRNFLDGARQHFVVLLHLGRLDSDETAVEDLNGALRGFEGIVFAVAAGRRPRLVSLFPSFHRQVRILDPIVDARPRFERLAERFGWTLRIEELPESACALRASRVGRVFREAAHQAALAGHADELGTVEFVRAMALLADGRLEATPLFGRLV